MGPIKVKSYASYLTQKDRQSGTPLLTPDPGETIFVKSSTLLIIIVSFASHVLSVPQTDQPFPENWNLHA